MANSQFRWTTNWNCICFQIEFMSWAIVKRHYIEIRIGEGRTATSSANIINCNTGDAFELMLNQHSNLSNISESACPSLVAMATTTVTDFITEETILRLTGPQTATSVAKAVAAMCRLVNNGFLSACQRVDLQMFFRPSIYFEQKCCFGRMCFGMVILIGLLGAGVSGLWFWSDFWEQVFRQGDFDRTFGSKCFGSNILIELLGAAPLLIYVLISKTYFLEIMFVFVCFPKIWHKLCLY